MENPIKVDDLGVPLFSETSILAHLERLQHLNPCRSVDLNRHRPRSSVESQRGFQGRGGLSWGCPRNLGNG